MKRLSKWEKVLLVGSALRGANCNDKIDMSQPGEPFGPQVAQGINAWLYEACEEGHGWMNALVRAALKGCGYDMAIGEALDLYEADRNAMAAFVNECAPTPEIISIALNPPDNFNSTGAALAGGD